MAHRYTVRRQDDCRTYYIWDNQTGAVAKTGNSEFRNLGFDEALDAAASLNDPGKVAA
jgi:hypothetical protein